MPDNSFGPDLSFVDKKVKPNRRAYIRHLFCLTISSTSCPGLILKLPRNRNPSCELSTMRHGYIFRTPPTFMTRRADFFDITRAERRPWETGKLGILHPLLAIKAHQESTSPSVSLHCSTGASSRMPRI